MHTPAGRDRYARFTHNLSLTGKRFRVMPEFSVPALMTLLKEEMSSTNPGFHWIYVDGSHEADDTFLDGELAWRLARKDAIVIFDDYNWDKEPLDSVHHPRRGIDSFMKLHEGQFERLSGPADYQMILKKTSDMRVGFLVNEEVDIRPVDALGFGINLVLAVDSRYAPAAAVAIRSTVNNTQGRITFYVVDCGLTEEEGEKIRSSVPESNDVTLLFLPLPENGFAKKIGVAWAKLDVIRMVPVEKVLYLDADTLVRASIKSLWDVDLRGREIGAVVDVGFPNGHDAITRGPYFNAGVLLIDLAKVRMRMHDLEKLAWRMKDSRFQDQDALNLHFKNEWLPLDLTWNGQGLGTYAEFPSADRQTLRLENMKNPNIVHFTGPVNPSMAQVLNPFVQPYTGKPWGYAGAPNHPHRAEWWEVLGETAWRDLRASEGYQSACEKEQEGAIYAAIKDFQERLRAVE